MKLPPEKFARGGGAADSQPSVSADPKKIILNSGEELYAEIRDRNFNAVGPILSKKAKLISAQFDVSAYIPIKT